MRQPVTSVSSDNHFHSIFRRSLTQSINHALLRSHLLVLEPCVGRSQRRLGCSRRKEMVSNEMIRLYIGRSQHADISSNSDGDNCAEKIKRQSYYYSYGYSSAGYEQSIIVPAMSAGYYSNSVVASVSAYPSYSSYPYYSSYAASSYGPQFSQAPSQPQPSRPHTGGYHRRPHGGSNGGQSAAQSSSAPNQGPKPNAASSTSSKSGGVFLTLGVLTGVVALIL